MRLLITGGAGTLGSVFAAHFSPTVESIHVVDNLATGKRESLAGLPDANFIEGSVSDEQLMMRVFNESQPTHIIHCAASYKDPDAVVEQTDSNVRGMAVLLEQAAKLQDLQTIMNLQTVLCYGRPDTTPIPVDAPLRPRNNYAITKVAAEELLIHSGLPYTSLRITNTITPGLAIGPIPTFYRRISEGQDCSVSEAARDFIDIADVQDLVDRMLERPEVGGVFNVSSGEGRTIEEIFNLVAEFLGKTVPVTMQPVSDDDVPVVVVDPTETQRVWGWKAKVDFHKSLNWLLSEYDQSGVGQIHSHFKGAKK